MVKPFSLSSMLFCVYQTYIVNVVVVNITHTLKYLNILNDHDFSINSQLDVGGIHASVFTTVYKLIFYTEIPILRKLLYQKFKFLNYELHYINLGMHLGKIFIFYLKDISKKGRCISAQIH